MQQSKANKSRRPAAVDSVEDSKLATVGPVHSTDSSRSAALTQKMEDRMLYVLLAMVGQRVQVTTKSGEVYQGLFHGSKKDSNFGLSVSLKYPRKMDAQNTKAGEVAAPLPENLLIPSNIFCQMSAIDTVDLGACEPTADTFRTDEEISGGVMRQRELTKWAGENGGDEIDMGLHGDVGTWDQFAINKAKFNVRSDSYKEEDYTTPLDHTTVDPRASARAERIANEIMKATSTNVHIAEERGQVIQTDYTEEEKYAGVLRSVQDGKRTLLKNDNEQEKTVSQPQSKDGHESPALPTENASSQPQPVNSTTQPLSPPACTTFSSQKNAESSSPSKATTEMAASEAEVSTVKTSPLPTDKSMVERQTASDRAMKEEITNGQSTTAAKINKHDKAPQEAPSNVSASKANVPLTSKLNPAAKEFVPKPMAPGAASGFLGHSESIRHHPGDHGERNYRRDANMDSGFGGSYRHVKMVMDEEMHSPQSPLAPSMYGVMAQGPVGPQAMQIVYPAGQFQTAYVMSSPQGSVKQMYTGQPFMMPTGPAYGGPVEYSIMPLGGGGSGLYSPGGYMHPGSHQTRYMEPRRSGDSSMQTANSLIHSPQPRPPTGPQPPQSPE